MQSKSRRTPTSARSSRLRAPASQASTSAICGTSPIAGASRSLRPSRQSSSGPSSTPSQRVEHLRQSKAAIPGLTSRTGVPARSGKSNGSQLVARALAAGWSAKPGRPAHLPQAQGATAAATTWRQVPQLGQQREARPPHPPIRRQFPTRPAASCRGERPLLPAHPICHGALCAAIEDQIVFVRGQSGGERAAGPQATDRRRTRPLSSSPSSQKAKIVSIAWRPSGSRPRTCSARLSLA